MPGPDVTDRPTRACRTCINFKHALVRDAAYESLLKSRRHQLHGQIARALEKSFAGIVASQPEIVAYHFTEASLVEPAVDYWLKGLPYRQLRPRGGLQAGL
jgi:predicted ATPase